jgi:hypothetical protein
MSFGKIDEKQIELNAKHQKDSLNISSFYVKYRSLLLFLIETKAITDPEVINCFNALEAELEILIKKECDSFVDSLEHKPN